MKNDRPVLAVLYVH